MVSHLKEQKENILEEMKDFLENNLPYGSGINDKWHYKRGRDYFSCDNVYDHMNEAGTYDRCIPFSVKIPDKAPMQFEVKFHCSAADRMFALRDDLRSYLGDTVADCIAPKIDEYKVLADSLATLKDKTAVR